MENNSDSCEKQKVSSDASNSVVKKKENSLRIRLVRVFSSGALKSPKSPTCISRSQSSSPSYSSSYAKARYSWRLPSKKESRTSFSSESSVSLSSLKSSVTGSTNSPTSPANLHTYFSTWYADKDDEVLAAATTAKGKEVGERGLLDRRYTESWSTSSFGIDRV